MNEQIFKEMPVPKAILTLALPTMLGMLVTVFYNMVDTFFVGQTGDPYQVAAVSLTMPVFMLLIACGNIFGIGGSSLISRLLGAGDTKKVKNVSAFCFYACIGLGIFATAVFLIFMPQILVLVGSSDDTIGFAKDYLSFIAMGAVFTIIQTAFGNILRSEGAAKQAMFGMMFGTVVNIILDPIMILMLDMGVAGAAIATVLGNMCSALYYIYYFKTKDTHLSISPKHFTLQKDIVKNILLIGTPASINNVLLSISNMVQNNYIASYGDMALSAMGITQRVFTLVIMLQLGLGMGIQPFIGYNYAAGNHKRMNHAIKFSIVFSMILGTAITFVYFFLSDVIIKVFINNPDVVSNGSYFLRAQISVAPIVGILFIFMNTFQAMGKPLPSLILSISRQGLAFFPIIIVFNALFGLEGIVWAQPASDLISVILAASFYTLIYRKMKQSKSIDTAQVAAASIADVSE